MHLLKHPYIRNTNYQAYCTTSLNTIPALNVTNTNNKAHIQIFKPERATGQMGLSPNGHGPNGLEPERAQAK